jgi:hypothetical protein
MSDPNKTAPTTIEFSQYRLIRGIEKFVERPASGTWIAFLALIAGCLASFFTDDIKTSVPFRWPGCDFPWPGHLNVIALSFWIVVGIWFVLFWVQQRVASKTIALLQKQAAEIAGKVTEVSKDVSTIGSDTHAIGLSTETIHQNVQLANESATQLRNASEDARKKIEHVDQAVNEVRQSAATLRLMMETLPIGGFIAEFGRLTAVAQDSVGSNITRQSKISEDELTKLLRDLLSIVSTLAEAYDGRSNVRYAANVMFFVPADSDPPYFSDPILALLKFWPRKEEALLDLDGVLVLTKDFTSAAHAHEKDHQVDDMLEEFAFAVPKEVRNDLTGQWRVLPGAPRVYVGEGVQSASPRTRTHVINDVANFDFRREVEIDEESLEELRAYYAEGGKGNAAKSCLTFPLLDSGGETYAVLNIHCNESPWLNGPGDRQRNFTMLVLPLVGEIANVMELLMGTSPS